MKTISISHHQTIPDNFTGKVKRVDGAIFWYQNGILHREDGPAIEQESGEKYWYQNGILHRKNGPAIIYPDGGKYWYQYGSLHRDDGPAVEETREGFVEWWQDGLCHRLDGPAVEWHYWERDDYYILGKELTEDEFEIFQTMWKQTLLERTDELIETFVKLVKMK